MTSVLDADMTTLARWGRSSFDWWIEELAGLVPAGTARWLIPRPPVTARFDGQDFALSRRGSSIASADGAVAVVLPASAALVRDVRLPPLGRADLKRLVALDAERLLPFAPGAAIIDFEAGPASDGGLPVAIAGLPIESARAALAAAEARGFDVRQLGIEAAGGGVRFDFLPGLGGGGAAHGSASRRLWWGLVGLAFVANLGVLIGRDVFNLRETEALVEAHGQAATSARQLRSRVLEEDARRRALLDRRRLGNPLPLLAATSRALPDSAWVQRLSWDTKQLRLSGFKGPGFDAVAALRRDPRFAAVRSAAVDVPSEASTSQPFDITADRRR